MKNNRIIFSIILCTYNRAKLLNDAIATILRQDFPHENFELLIVDNSSTDNTYEVSLNYCNKYPNIRYLKELKIGLSNARNRGWREARGIYIGFLDDDCKVPQEWLSVAFEIMEKFRPEAFGGPYYPFYNSPKPKWFKDEYASHVEGAVPRPLKDKEYLSGGNMFIQRGLLDSFGGFKNNLGMTGDQIGYGEETFFFNLLRINNPQAILYYEPRLFVYHLVRAEKMMLSLVPQRFFSVGRCYCRTLSIIKKKKPILSFLYVFLTLFKILYTYTLGIIIRDRNDYPNYENFIYENSKRLFITLGLHIETLLMIFNHK